MVAGSVDALPPPPPAVVAPAAATDFQPRSERERELCEKASQFDWLYMSTLVVSNVATIYADTQWFRDDLRPGARLVGPGLVGLAWGWTLGAIYPALPKCNKTWVTHPPPEGDVRSSLPFAVSLSLVAGVTAPMLVGIETGPYDFDWTLRERTFRVLVPGFTGILGAFMPYLLPPKAWRAAKELENLRAYGDDKGAFIGYRLRF
jgi:hypothetical protein